MLKCYKIIKQRSLEIPFNYLWIGDNFENCFIENDKEKIYYKDMEYGWTDNELLFNENKNITFFVAG